MDDIQFHQKLPRYANHIVIGRNCKRQGQHFILCCGHVKKCKDTRKAYTALLKKIRNQMISHFTKINVQGHKDKLSTILEKKYLTSVIRLETYAVTTKLTAYLFITEV